VTEDNKEQRIKTAIRDRKKRETLEKKLISDYSCPKCDHSFYDIGEIRAAGGLFSAFLNVENKRFTHISCARCSYTEFYNRRVSSMDKVLDFIGG
jgi:predicted nucleic-acid-binding Zn-ribbon protein